MVTRASWRDWLKQKTGPLESTSTKTEASERNLFGLPRADADHRLGASRASLDQWNNRFRDAGKLVETYKDEEEKRVRVWRGVDRARRADLVAGTDHG
jgi:hypothetical protein